MKKLITGFLIGLAIAQPVMHAGGYFLDVKKFIDGWNGDYRRQSDVLM